MPVPYLTLKTNYMINRETIFESANERKLFVRVDGKLLPAKIYGLKLDYPVIATEDNKIQCEISWGCVARLATGEQNSVTFN